MASVAIVLGSVRPGRAGEQVVRWIEEQARLRSARLPAAALCGGDAPVDAGPRVARGCSSAHEHRGE